MWIKFNVLQEHHLDKVRYWRMLPEVTRYMYTDPIITPESQLEWFKKVDLDNSQTNWVVSVDNVDIGFVSLKIDSINKRGFWAYYIGESEYLGKGIGKQIELNILNYVFESLNLHKLTCEVFEFNDKVIKIHEKYGSKVEGLLKEHVYKNNIPYNVVIMGILKDEWLKIKENFQIIHAEIEEK